MRTALTIAGSDSSGGAGIQADLKTFAAHGVYGTSAITAVTAQNTRGVSSIEAVSAEMVVAQMEAVAGDIGVDAAKTGMLMNAAITEAVAAAVAELDIPFLVVDPVMVATGGDRLLDDDALDTMRTELLPRAFVVTPNVPEAEALAGMTIRTDQDRREAARRILKTGAAAVILKGGHHDTPDIVDLLYDGHRFTEFRAVRVEGRSTHGTGCTFAAALAAYLALGRSLTEAIPLVQEYIAGAIRHGIVLGRGPAAPMDHFWRFRAGPSG